MAHPDPMSRPSAGRVLSHPFLRSSSPKAAGGGGSAFANRELAKELAAAKQRLHELEMQLALQKFKNKDNGEGEGGDKQQAEGNPEPSTSAPAASAARREPASEPAVPRLPGSAKASSSSTGRKILVGRGARKSLSSLSVMSRKD